MSTMSRRQLLEVSLGAAVATGTGVMAASPASASTDAAEREACSCAPPPALAPVPGMVGNRLANEVWYQLDEIGQNSPSQAFSNAIGTVFGALSAAAPGVNPEVAMPGLWISMREQGTYPDAFVSIFEPVRDSMQVISDTQMTLYNTYYCNNWAGLTGAMADFGQGILYDPRRPVGQKVHTMDGTPPPGYTTWHAYNRAFQLLGISPEYWSRFDPIVGIGWELQSIAQPVQDAHNQPLPLSTVGQTIEKWLRMTPDEADTAFMSFPYPPGIS